MPAFIYTGKTLGNFLPRVNQKVKELERVERLVEPKDIGIVNLCGLTPLYDAEVRTLKSSSD